VKCPHCHQEFELSWGRYLRLTIHKFACPYCGQRSICDVINPVMGNILMFGGAVIGLLGVAIAKVWLGVPGCIVGVLPLAILALPVGRMADRRWGKLRAVGESEPRESAVCAECKAEFGLEEMVRHNDLYYCGRCKPVFLQKLTEGSINGRRARRKHEFRSWWFWFWVGVIAVGTWFVLVWL
jgi:hypothetical protein